MAAVNRQQVVGGALVGMALLGLCSCSADTEPSGSGSPQPGIEQTVEPSVPPTVSPDEQWPGANAAGIVPDGLEFSALEDGYVFSDMPQSSGEQWIFDNYPEMWEQGVRAVSSVNTLLSYDGNSYEPGPTVQYINGQRYEGTPEVPLGFRGQVDNDPNEFPTDIIDNVKESLRDPSKPMAQTGNTGAGGYAVDIMFNPNYERLPPSEQVIVYVRQAQFDGINDSNSPRKFPDYQTALDWVLNNPITFNMEGEGLRELNRGEIGVIGVAREKMDGTRSLREFGVYNPDTGKIDWVS